MADEKLSVERLIIVLFIQASLHILNNDLLSCRTNLNLQTQHRNEFLDLELHMIQGFVMNVYVNYVLDSIRNK